MFKLGIFLLIPYFYFIKCESNIPIVITTWNFKNSTIKAWEVLKTGGTALDAVEQGASVCEAQQCDGTVGYGGSPDEDGETTLDALIMDGKTMNVGAVGALRRVKSAISVARHVLEHSYHSFLVGELATQFAEQMGFPVESLTTPKSKEMWKKWRNEDNCQPNFWMYVTPDPRQSCGPYSKITRRHHHSTRDQKVDQYNHDTIGMVAVDRHGDVAAGTSTNGAKFKMPGRIGDSPIPGAGAYADNTVGGAAATGDGDVMLRFLPSFLAVEEMRRGAAPTAAAETAVARIAAHYQGFMGAVVALTKDGAYGAACHGIHQFPFVVSDHKAEQCRTEHVLCS
ncbi:N(4)-(Beta-N-acetylglucosaminyl)-L-asparaginase-like [Cydia fagiglandana]|uniref:N(4)-(Beta-N-acetylglucosaminyl)-L-asparaginase- like n=1 Tax=Cydia fagiglandana TaxID=1458189 RepID=UPI002FEE1EE6